MFLLAMPETGFYNKTEEYSYPECFFVENNIYVW